MGCSAIFETGYLSGNKSDPRVGLRGEISLSKCIIKLLIVSKQQRENILNTKFSF